MRTNPETTAEAERRAFEALFRPHFGRMYGLALRLCRNARDAEDLVQDSLLRAFRFLHHFDPESNARAWLYKILTNTFANRYRKEARERELLASFRQIERLVDKNPVPPDVSYEQGRFSMELEQALGNLPADFRLAVLLADVEELSYKEIADIMACPIGTVMSRLARGRKLLRVQLAASSETAAPVARAAQAAGASGQSAALRVVSGGGDEHGDGAGRQGEVGAVVKGPWPDHGPNKSSKVPS